MFDSEDSDDKQESADLDDTQRHLQAMAEYIKRESKASSVQIIITRKTDDPNEIETYGQGVGNIYERIGAVTLWLKAQ